MRKFVLGLAVFGAVLAPVWFAAAGLGAKLGLWDWRFGLGTMTREIGPMIVIGAAVIAGIALLWTLIKPPRKHALIAAVCLAVPLMVLGRLAGAQQVGLSLPPIHDVQTNWEAPIQPSDVLIAQRGEGANAIQDAPVIGEALAERWPAFAGKTNAEAQAMSYPYLEPIETSLERDAAFVVVREVIEARGWPVVYQDPRVSGVIEATAETFWYGFKDDVLARVQAREAGGTVIDLRSVSRVGLSDLGANAKRLNELSRDIKIALRAAERAGA